MGRARLTPLRWYVAVTEYWIKHARGVYRWEPKVVVHRLVDGQWVNRTVPMFEGYMLLGSRRGWRHIEEATGAELLRDSREPLALREDELDDIRAREIVETCYEPRFDRGQSVMVDVRARSSYAGLEGRFVQSVVVSGGKLARVQFDLYGEAEVEACLPIDYLKAR